MQITYLQDPEYFRSLLRRSLRKPSVDQAAWYTRWFLLILATGLLTFAVVTGINAYLYVQHTRPTFRQLLLPKVDVPTASSEVRANYGAIVEKNIFGSLGPKTVAAPAKPQVKLPLVLIGTFLAPGEIPYAIVEDDKKKIQDVFNINDSMFGEAKLLNIYADKVQIDRRGSIEFLTLDDAPDIASASSSNPNATEVSVDQQELDEALQNLPVLLTQARAVPYFKDGKAVGLRMFSIKAGSMYEKIGLQNGDILKGINGNSLSDMSQAMRLFEMLKAEKSISVTLERNREQKEFQYQIR